MQRPLSYVIVIHAERGIGNVTGDHGIAPTTTTATN